MPFTAEYQRPKHIYELFEMGAEGKAMRIVVFFVLLAVLAGSARADEKPAGQQMTIVIEGLKNPCGVAIQPDTGDVFLAESGAGRIVRIKNGQAEAVITDFPLDIYGQGPKYAIGPLGLAFINKNTLAVGGGGRPDGQELLRIYSLPEAGKSIKADAMLKALGPLPAAEVNNDAKSSGEQNEGEGNFYAVAVTPAAIYATSNGDDNKGWVVRAEIQTNGFGPLTRFLATKEAVGVDAPVAVVISPRGELVIGQMGEIGETRDSLLTFYNARSGKLLLNLDTGLADITALAYSSKGLLYALDFSWTHPEEGGLFRLDSLLANGVPAVRAVKIISLEKPTAMAVGPNGAIYITLLGSADGVTGKLVVLPAGL